MVPSPVLRLPVSRKLSGARGAVLFAALAALPIAADIEVKCKSVGVRAQALGRQRKVRKE